MNCVQISKKAQRNWSTAGKQAFPLKYEQIYRQLICGLCRVWQEGKPRKAREKKQPTQPTPDIKRKKMKKPELIGLKLIGLSGWNILFLNIIQAGRLGF